MAAVSQANLLVDAFERVKEDVHGAVTGLTAEQLLRRVDSDANPIGWLVWHLARVQDDHVAEVAGAEQVYTAAGWAQRLGLPYDARAVGYGQSSADVGRFRCGDGALLLAYYDAVHEATIGYVAGLGGTDLARIVDERWNPPVTLAVRLISVINDDTQHAGQAAYVRGLVERSG